MENEEREILKKNLPAILQSLNPKDKVTDYLFSQGVLSSSERTELRDCAEREEQADRLVRILPSRGKQAFAEFVRALDTSESLAHKELASILKRRPAPVPAVTPVRTEPAAASTPVPAVTPVRTTASAGDGTPDKKAALDAGACIACSEGRLWIQSPYKKWTNYKIGCDGFPECEAYKILPDYVCGTSTTKKKCQECGELKVRLHFRSRRCHLRPPFLEKCRLVGCIRGCDPQMVQIGASFSKDNSADVANVSDKRPYCKCGVITRRWIVKHNRNGNRGRPFLSCAMCRDDCYFEFLDGDSAVSQTAPQKKRMHGDADGTPPKRVYGGMASAEDLSDD